MVGVLEAFRSGGPPAGTLAGLLLLGALAPASASAQPASAEEPPASEADAEARRFFEEGRAAYDRGDYAVAASLFEAALARTREVRVRVLMLLNAAQAYDRLGRDEEALDRYEQYARLMPDGPRIELVRERIAALRRRLGRDPLGGAPDDGDGGGWVPWAVGGAVLVAGVVVAVVLLAPGGEEELPEEVGPVDWNTTALRTGGAR